MMLSPQEFDDRMQAEELCLALIGMSGIGKSYRSRQLGTIGFRHVSCDDLIAARLSSLLPSKDVKGLAAWMGQPYMQGYSERERQYLELEEETVGDALASGSGNTVIDATGSVVYLSVKIRDRIKAESLIVHLEADEADYARLFDRYMADPKPVVWGDAFDIRASETTGEALARCYPSLLRRRLEKYTALADVSVPLATAPDRSISALDFLNGIRERLVH